jgi:hypothetical protein
MLSELRLCSTVSQPQFFDVLNKIRCSAVIMTKLLIMQCIISVHHCCYERGSEHCFVAYSGTLPMEMMYEKSVVAGFNVAQN